MIQLPLFPLELYQLDVEVCASNLKTVHADAMNGYALEYLFKDISRALTAINERLIQIEKSGVVQRMNKLGIVL